MIRISSMTVSVLVACIALPIALAAPAAAQPATTSCLGQVASELSCPDGTKLRANDSAKACYRKNEGKTGWAWLRHGPSVWHHLKDAKPIAAIRRAGNYVDHKKHGRHFYFTKQGKLERIVDYQNDDYGGYVIECHDNGQVKSMTTYKGKKIEGLVRRWNRDGSFKYASQYKNGKYVGRIKDGSAAGAAPAGLCQPKTCDLNAKVGTLP
ncbi:MAG: hypothetical protein AAGC55_31880 [Myxococcota bacterium]